MQAYGNSEESPLVSVLVLSYNNLDGVFPTLESVLSQDYPNIEIVISDDGTPGFASMVPSFLSYVENFPGPRRELVLNSIAENLGTVRNVNLAVGLAHGRYIKTISPADVFTTNSAISDYMRFMLSHDFLVCFAKMRGVDNNGEIYRNLAACDTDYGALEVLSPKEILDRLYARNFLPGAAEFFDRKVFDEYGLFDERIRLIEDYTYWLHLARNDVRFGFLDKVLIDYSLSGVSSSGSYSATFMKDLLSVYALYIFPFDKRYGVFQPVYNFLKKGGLNYYLEKSAFSEMSFVQKIWFRVKYFPYCIYTRHANRNSL